MKNNRGLALPIVMVFMFLSHLTYISLLAYNQIQSQRYQGLIEYYQARSMMEITLNRMKVTDAAFQLAESINANIATQENYLLRNYMIKKVEVISPQLKILVTETNGVEKLIVLSHQLFIAPPKHETVVPEDYLIDGILLNNGMTEVFETAPQQIQSDQMVSEMELLHWKKISQIERNFRKSMTLQPPDISQLEFNLGWVDIYPQSDQIQYKVYLPGGRLVYRYEQVLEPIDFIITTTMMIFQKDLAGGV